MVDLYQQKFLDQVLIMTKDKDVPQETDWGSSENYCVFMTKIQISIVPSV